MSDKKTVNPKRLRSGFTTGACAAASARAAVEVLLGIGQKESVTIPMPSGNEATFKIKERKLTGKTAYASVTKDAGDDPDVTNGLEIGAEARLSDTFDISVKGGKGVGTVTLPGLPVEVGHSAINPIPMKMIRDAVTKALNDAGRDDGIDITIIVPEGEEAAKKTLNARLGIKGGISILGTTGIVKPLSAEAWQATITSSMKVARAMGLDTAVLSSGRTSERAAMEKFSLPEAACAMMGDHVEFSLSHATEHGFTKIMLAAQWAKMIKIAMGIPDTHVRAGALETNTARDFLISLGINLQIKDFNTAREMLDYIHDTEDLKKICAKAAEYARRVSGLEVTTALVSYEGEVIVTNG